MYPVTIYLCHMYEFNQETKPAKARGTTYSGNLNEQIHYSSFKENRSVDLARFSRCIYFLLSRGYMY